MDNITLQDLILNDIISLDDVTQKINMIKSRRIKDEVLKVHRTENGNIRTIKYLENKGLYQTILPNKKRITAMSEEGIYQKLYQYYGLDVNEFTFEHIFGLALSEKEKTDNNSPQTITRYRFDFNSSIGSLRDKDIRKVSVLDLKEYTAEYVKSQPTKKRFLAFKSVLNLIYNYAIEHEILTFNLANTIKPTIYLKGCKNVIKNKTFTQNELNRIKMNVPKNAYGYGILLAIETGMRSGELCSLKWSDIDYGNGLIHIHSQQLSRKGIHKKEYYYVEWTKDEKGISKGGRYFPLTKRIMVILQEIRDNCPLGEYILCDKGKWITTDNYEKHLRILCKSLDLSVWNNHAFRMSLNSYVLIAKLNLPVTERAKLLGHSVETNLRHYSFAEREGIDKIREKMNNLNNSHLTLTYAKNKESPKRIQLKAFKEN